jgi:hypothetical protein
VKPVGSIRQRKISKNTIRWSPLFS